MYLAFASYHIPLILEGLDMSIRRLLCGFLFVCLTHVSTPLCQSGSSYSDTKNLARSCSEGPCLVTSSSYYVNIYNPDPLHFGPQKVVDGGLITVAENEDGPHNYFYCSNDEINQWVMIDLQYSTFIKFIRIYSYPGSESNLINFEIQVGNNSIISSNPICTTNQPQFVGFKDFNCNMIGRYVSVRQFATRILAILEIEVYGCAKCAAGTYKSAAGSAACTMCLANEFSTTVGAVSNTTCIKCPNNSISTEGSTQCLCKPGYTGDGTSTCLACITGKYKTASGSAVCTDCVVGSHTAVTASTFATDCLCIAGYTGPNGGPCTACARHTFKNSMGTSECTACDGNLSSPLGGTSCSACVAGTYKSSWGSMACTACPPNTTSPTGSTSFAGCVCRRL